MSDKLVFEIEIKTTGRYYLESEAGAVVMIPFEGKLESEQFTGVILPGACDTQVIDNNDIKHMSARYILEGYDSKMNKCKLFIENNGYFHKDMPHPFKTIPVFYTDSPILDSYLRSRNFRGEGMREQGILKIRFFEISKRINE